MHDTISISEQLEAWRTSKQQRERLYMLAIQGDGRRMIRKRVAAWRRAKNLHFNGRRAAKHMRDHVRWTVKLITLERRLGIIF